jgi:hypothetical protein
MAVLHILIETGNGEEQASKEGRRGSPGSVGHKVHDPALGLAHRERLDGVGVVGRDL